MADQPSTPRALLALEASGGACSVALWRAGRVVAHRRQLLRNGHARVLMPLVAETMQASGLPWPDIALVGATVGPGSFTGIRVGLAAARGLALACGTRAVGITSFEALAHGVPPHLRAGRALLVVLDSRRAELFAQPFDEALNPIGPPALAAAEAIAGLMPHAGALVVADGPLALPGLEPLELGPPDAAVVARLLAERCAAGMALAPAQALYLRPPDAVVPEAGGRLRGTGRPSGRPAAGSRA